MLFAILSPVRDYTAMATKARLPETERHWLRVLGTLNEAQARVFVAQKALEEGRGAVSRLARLTSMSRPTILADRLGMALTVCHYPPGTSKWNQAEHRLFSFISMNRRGRPLLSYEAVVNLMGGTTTKSGLRVKALLDTREYEPGEKITDAEMRTLRLKHHRFHGDWNYTSSRATRRDFGQR